MRNQLTVAAMICLTACGICVFSGTARASIQPPAFTDTRVTPVGNDKLDVSLLIDSDTWSVDLMMNQNDVEVNGKLTPQEQVSGIWRGTGPNDATKTIHTLAQLRLNYKLGTAFYQYQFHDTRGSTHVQYDYYPGPYSYQM